MVNKVAVATTTIEIVVPTTAIGSENNLKIVKLVIELNRERERERQRGRVLYEQKRWRKEKHFTTIFTTSSLSISSEFSASLLASCPKRKM